MTRLFQKEELFQQFFSRHKATANLQVCCFEEVRSTMDVAKNLLFDKKISTAAPALIDAEKQSLGRGRQGRSWYACDDALKFTLVLPTAETQTGLPLVCVAIMHKFLKQYDAKLIIKWPNDLLDSLQQKLSGILIERINVEGRKFDLVGIGINSYTIPDGVRATCLAKVCQKTFNQQELYANLVLTLVSEYESYCSQGFASFRDYWLENTLPVGSEVKFHTAGESISGKFVSITKEGLLILNQEGKLTMHTNGDVELA